MSCLLLLVPTYVVFAICCHCICRNVQHVKESEQTAPKTRGRWGLGLKCKKHNKHQVRRFCFSSRWKIDGVMRVSQLPRQLAGYAIWLHGQFVVRFHPVLLCKGCLERLLSKSSPNTERRSREPSIRQFSNLRPLNWRLLS